MTNAGNPEAKAKRVRFGGGAAERGRAASIKARQAKAKGRAIDLAPIIADLRTNGATTLREIAEGLNDRGIPTARGGAWSAMQVQRVVAATASR